MSIESLDVKSFLLCVVDKILVQEFHWNYRSPNKKFWSFIKNKYSFIFKKSFYLCRRIIFAKVMFSISEKLTRLLLLNFFSNLVEELIVSVRLFDVLISNQSFKSEVKMTLLSKLWRLDCADTSVHKDVLFIILKNLQDIACGMIKERRILVLNDREFFSFVQICEAFVDFCFRETALILMILSKPKVSFILAFGMETSENDLPVFVNWQSVKHETFNLFKLVLLPYWLSHDHQQIG